MQTLLSMFILEQLLETSGKVCKGRSLTVSLFYFYANYSWHPDLLLLLLKA